LNVRENRQNMSATVAYILLAVTVLALVGVGIGGWWMVEATLGEEEEEPEQPPSGGRTA
jgi:flagellar basal body-associated protein FliL